MYKVDVKIKGDDAWKPVSRLLLACRQYSIDVTIIIITICYCYVACSNQSSNSCFHPHYYLDLFQCLK